MVCQVPFLEQFGYQIKLMQKGGVAIALSPRQDMMNHFGTYQAGVYMTIMEVVGGLQCSYVFDLQENFMITKKAESTFFYAAAGPVCARAVYEQDKIVDAIETLQSKKKATITIKTEIVDSDSRIIVAGINIYYLRVGMPRIFARAN